MLRAALLTVTLAAASPHVAAGSPARWPEVYQLHPLTDAAVLGTSLAVVAIPSLLDTRIIDARCPCDTREIPGFDRFALRYHSGTASGASDVTLGLALAVPPALDLLVLGWSPAFVEDAVVYGEALAVASALAQIAKYGVQRPLPRTYAGDPRFVSSPRGYRSFYSGHATLTFAALSSAAMTVRLRYGEQIWPWVVTGVAGTSVIVERVAAGRHFPSDVVAGALSGLAVGVAVPLLHRRQPGELEGVRLAPSPAGAGLAVGGRF
jgi:membrane-associated phospholipid phosphatase